MAARMEREVLSPKSKVQGQHLETAIPPHPTQAEQHKSGPTVLVPWSGSRDKGSEAAIPPHPTLYPEERARQRDRSPRGGGRGW
jgi:hypothetical protein